MEIRKFCGIFRTAHKISSVSHGQDILNFFDKLKEGIDKEDISSLIIGDYLYKNITSEKVRKRKSSATEFEDFLDYALDGKVTDKKSRKNIPLGKMKNVSPLVAKHISSNRREKMDIIFSNNYGVSLKTSIPENKEINLGSFAREALFKGFLSPKEYGGERKSGLGSKPQMRTIFEKIKRKGKWKKFCDRFKLMADNIYIDDLIFVIKADKKIELYLIAGKTLRGSMIKALISGPSKAITVINRYEGNSLRVERNKIISKGKKVSIDLSKIENSKLSKLLNHFAEIEDRVLDHFCEKKTAKCEAFLSEKFKEILKEFK